MNYLNHAPINFYFAKNARNFVVEEIPLYDFSGNGEHLVLKVRKKGLTTREMIYTLSENLGIKSAEIGYAGLKDKDALTTQYISINKKFAKNIEQFRHENIKILNATYYNNKLKLGHLSGNKFFIRLKKIDSLNALKIQEICKILSQNGMPNYFGTQRFGKFGDNFTQGREILEGKLKIRNKKTAQFLISAFQSKIFNEWLKSRVELCKMLESFSINEVSSRYKIAPSEVKSLQNQPHFFKILSGEIISEYPFGKLKTADESSVEQFLKREIAPTGPLFGKKMKNPTQTAQKFESQYYDSLLDNQIGDRRTSWVFPQDLEFCYKKESAQGELKFTLPKGSYGTVFLAILGNNRTNF